MYHEKDEQLLRSELERNRRRDENEARSRGISLDELYSDRDRYSNLFGLIWLIPLSFVLWLEYGESFQALVSKNLYVLTVLLAIVGVLTSGFLLAKTRAQKPGIYCVVLISGAIFGVLDVPP